MDNFKFKMGMNNRVVLSDDDLKKLTEVEIAHYDTWSIAPKFYKGERLTREIVSEREKMIEWYFSVFEEDAYPIAKAVFDSYGSAPIGKKRQAKLNADMATLRNLCAAHSITIDAKRKELNVSLCYAIYTDNNGVTVAGYEDRCFVLR